MNIVKLFFVTIAAVLSLKSQAAAQAVGTLNGPLANKMMSAMIEFSRVDKGVKVGARAGRRFAEIRNLVCYAPTRSYGGENCVSNQPNYETVDTDQYVPPNRYEATIKLDVALADAALPTGPLRLGAPQGRSRMNIHNGNWQYFEIYTEDMEYQTAARLSCNETSGQAQCIWLAPY